MINIIDLSKTYGASDAEVHALQEVSFRIEQGEWVSITGPSGSGKSTLANILAGLLPATSGECEILGVKMSSASDAQKASLRASLLGYVHQDFNLISYLSTAENICLPDLIAGRKPDLDKCRRILESIQMEDKENAFPDELSGGQKQRTAIGRALYMDCKVLIADEPTGNLDPESRDAILDLFEELHQQGMTLILITHDAAAAARSDRILRIEKGRLV